MNDASRNVPRPVAWAALTALALILAGCGVHYDFVIHDNETADMTYIMWDTSSLQLITKEKCNEKELGKSSPLPDGVEATYTYTSHNGDPACQVTAKSVPVNKLKTDTWTIKHKDGRYIFDLSPGSLSKLGSKNPQLSSQDIGGSTKVSVSVTFPGEVTKSNGRNDGNKVTWDNALESSEGLHAEGEDGKFQLRWWMIAAAGGVVLLIVAGVMLYLFRVRHAQQRDPIPLYGEAPQDAGAAGASRTSSRARAPVSSHLKTQAIQPDPASTVPRRAPASTAPRRALVSTVPRKAPASTVPRKAPASTVPRRATGSTPPARGTRRFPSSRFPSKRDRDMVTRTSGRRRSAPGVRANSTSRPTRADSRLSCLEPALGRSAPSDGPERGTVPIKFWLQLGAETATVRS